MLSPVVDKTYAITLPLCASLRLFAPFSASNSAARSIIVEMHDRPAARRSDDRVAPVTVEPTPPRHGGMR